MSSPSSRAVFVALLAGWAILVTGCGADSVNPPDRVNGAIEFAFAGSVPLGGGLTRGSVVAVTSVGPMAADASDWGTEVPLRAFTPGDDVVAIGTGWPLGRPSAMAGYVGEIADTGARAFVVRRVDPSTGAATLGTIVRLADATGAHEIGFDGSEPVPAVAYADRLEPKVVIVAFIPPHAAAIVVRLADGHSFWQRPVGGTAFISLPDGSSAKTLTVEVLDTTGRLIVKRDFAT